MLRRVLISTAVVAVLPGCGAPLDAGPTAAASDVRGRIVRVVDGDTVKVLVGSRRETVRLIGIDTPELQRPGSHVECGAKAATRALERLALTRDGRGRSVVLRLDPTQDRRDRFGRLLAYVDLVTGADLGREQVRAGWAQPRVYDGPYERWAVYRREHRAARAGPHGVFRLCGGF